MAKDRSLRTINCENLFELFLIFWNKTDSELRLNNRIRFHEYKLKKFASTSKFLQKTLAQLAKVTYLCNSLFWTNINRVTELFRSLLRNHTILFCIIKKQYNYGDRFAANYAENHFCGLRVFIPLSCRMLQTLANFYTTHINQLSYALLSFESWESYIIFF